MDRDFLIELFSAFGPVSLRRMFSGYGISVDGVTFALVLRGAIFLKVDDQSVPRFEAEGVGPFQYESRSCGRTVTVASYWQMPDRLYDDPEELAEWARLALGAAERGAVAKRARAKPRKRAVAKASRSMPVPSKPKSTTAKAAKKAKRGGKR
ncbi:MAG: TfoX/Sxy family protein [Xanthobacteraceae bacterium]|nr:TfoX/Sxy family protein [Xanthobacteraceae bacterium]